MAICCPKTFTGFCLEDNTPIAITIDNGVLLKWTNLVTGVVTPGNPPAGTGVCEATVTVEIPPIEVAPLTCEKDSVTICPGAEPIPITGTVTVEFAPLTCIKDAVTVCQGTSPWVVSGTVAIIEPVTVDAIDFDIRNLLFATDKVDVSGSVVALDAPTLAALETITVNQGTSPWVVTGSFSSQPLDCATDSVEVCQGTSPWVVSGTVSVTEPVTVDAIDFDIRNLLFATDKVDVSDSSVALDAATLAALETITVLQGTSPWIVSGTLSSSPLTCATDSITVCPPASGFGVSVSNFPASVEVSNDVGNPLPVTVISGGVTTTEQSLVPKGYQQITPVVSTALTVPPGAIYALMQARVADISYRDDGVAPTITVGMRIVIDNSLFYTGNLAAVRVISVVGGVLDILYYGVV